MRKIVIITKTGSCKTTPVKSVELDTLYKKCKFRKAENFEKRATWKNGDNWVSVYARDTGRAGGENKYDLPPPVDKELYFGAMAVLAHTTEVPTNESIVDITDAEWQKVYETCMGGFEDLGNEDSEEEEEEIPEHLKTASGYMKDGFVVDDDEDDDDEDFIPDSEDSEEDKDVDDSDDDNDAEYGGETGDEQEEDDEDDDEEDSDEEEEDDTGAASELSEEEYVYK